LPKEQAFFDFFYLLFDYQLIMFFLIVCDFIIKKIFIIIKAADI